MKQTIDILSSQNTSFKHTIDQKDYEISFLNKKLEQLQEKTELYSKKIEMLDKTSDKFIENEKKLLGQIEEYKGRMGD